LKFFNKLLFSAINVCAVLATINDKQQHDDTFNFWVSGPRGGTATLTGLRKNPTTAKSITIPAYVYVEGIKFRVEGTLDHTFSGENCPFETIYVSSNVESFHFDHYSFTNCKKLKYVYLYNDKITAEATAFKDVNKDVVFYSKGTKSFVNNSIDRLVNSLSIPKKNYSSLSSDKQMENLFNIAKIVSSYLRTSNIKDSGSVAVNILTKFATRDGYARLFRFLAIASGFPQNNILVGGDNNGHYWNYIKIGSYWYNVDINYAFRVYNQYSDAVSRKPFFLSNSSFKKRLNENYSINVDPKNFVVWFTNYGYPDEFRGQQTYENFNNYVNSHGGYRF